MGQKEPNKELIFIDICRELAKSSSGTLFWSDNQKNREKQFLKSKEEINDDQG